jgi:hypothetical protein
MQSYLRWTSAIAALSRIEDIFAPLPLPATENLPKSRVAKQCTLSEGAVWKEEVLQGGTLDDLILFAILHCHQAQEGKSLMNG